MHYYLFRFSVLQLIWRSCRVSNYKFNESSSCMLGMCIEACKDLTF